MWMVWKVSKEDAFALKAHYYRRTALLTLTGIGAIPNRLKGFVEGSPIGRHDGAGYVRLYRGLLSFLKRESQDNAVCLRWNMLPRGRVWSYDLTVSRAPRRQFFGSGLSRGNCTDVKAILEVCWIVLWVCNARNSWVLLPGLIRDLRYLLQEKAAVD